MNETALSFILLGPVVLMSAGALYAVSRIKKNAIADKAINKQINNAIVDLYEEGYIKVAGEKDNRMVEKVGDRKYPKELHNQILSYGFGGDTLLGAKTFHINLYKARKNLVSALNTDSGYDSTTKPSDRIYSQTADEGSMVLLPLLLLGTPEGSHFSGNPAYAGSSDYIGGSDFGGGGSSSGGDSGGGDGGGGD